MERIEQVEEDGRSHFHLFHSLFTFLPLSLPFFTHRRGHSLWFASVHTYTFTLICVLALLLMQNGNIERTFDGKRNIRATAE